MTSLFSCLKVYCFYMNYLYSQNHLKILILWKTGFNISNLFTQHRQFYNLSSCFPIFTSDGMFYVIILYMYQLSVCLSVIKMLQSLSKLQLIVKCHGRTLDFHKIFNFCFLSFETKFFK